MTLRGRFWERENSQQVVDSALRLPVFMMICIDPPWKSSQRRWGGGQKQWLHRWGNRGGMEKRVQRQWDDTRVKVYDVEYIVSMYLLALEFSYFCKDLVANNVFLWEESRSYVQKKIPARSGHSKQNKHMIQWYIYGKWANKKKWLLLK